MSLTAAQTELATRAGADDLVATIDEACHFEAATDVVWLSMTTDAAIEPAPARINPLGIRD